MLLTIVGYSPIRAGAPPERQARGHGCMQPCLSPQADTEMERKGPDRRPGL